MATNFSTLRNSRKTLIDKLTAEVKKSSGPKNAPDERYWKLTTDAKTGIGYARIRFLAAPKGEDIPWARIFSHGFQGPGGSWFIENCPTTLSDRPCPVCKMNNGYWNSGVESDKQVARDRKRKLSFVSNILVIEDPTKPENNGKVFLFRYGKKIHDKIMELMEPQFPDQQPTNPFDFWEGCDFKLKAQKVAGYQNYDKSEFTDPSELFAGDDAKKESLWETQYALTEIVGEDQFKSYDELTARLTRALTGDVGDKPETAGEVIEREAALPTPAPARAPRAAAPRPARTVAAAPVATADDETTEEDEDKITKFFADVLDAE